MPPIYLDYNASTPLLPVVIKAMQEYLQSGFGNPSSSHYYGFENRRLIEKTRRQVADLIGCLPEEIIFTSGGTESNNFALRGIAELHPGGHIITSSIEHPSILEVCKYLEKKGYKVSYLPVDSYGRIRLEEVERAIRPDTFLITIMLANNEVGTIQPIRAVTDLAHKHNILVHTDAAQAIGKIRVNVEELNVDLLSIAGHKIYAPKGIGALYIRKGTKISPLLFGAGHEQGLRPGTENVLEIVGLGAASEYLSKNLDQIIEYLQKIGWQFYKGLKDLLPEVELNGDFENKLPNTFNLYFPGIDASSLLSALPEIAASTGAACHAGKDILSHVLTAMGYSRDRIIGSIRFSLGYLNTSEEIEKAVKIIAEKVNELKPKEKIRQITPDFRSVKLTHYTHGLGCACKIRPQNLQQILKSLTPQLAEAVQVGFETSDDAAVYKLSDDLSLVTTVDFFPPIVDDPYHFGRIAAANALSDIYAMGAKPLLALNIVAFPEKRLPLEILELILKGAQSIAAEAEIPILGGHTIEDNEPKFGWCLIGTVHPNKIWRNTGAQPGDKIILTKPIGVGILTTALKHGLLKEETEKNIINLMATLNKEAAQIIQNYPVHACTDITGFGLLGHLLEMLQDENLGAKISLSKVPFIPEAIDFAYQNIFPGGSYSNLEYVNPYIKWPAKITNTEKLLLADPQTSGGLLVAIPQEEAEDLICALNHKGVPAVCIGEFITSYGFKIEIAE